MSKDFICKTKLIWVCFFMMSGLSQAIAGIIEPFDYANESNSKTLATHFFNQGIRFQQGIDAEKNLRRAAIEFSIAAALNHSKAQCNLGMMLIKGIGVKKNEKKAVQLFLQSAIQENEIGEFNLGLCFERGIVVKQNMNEALRLYRLSAKHGYERAKRRLNDLSK